MASTSRVRASAGRIFSTTARSLASRTHTHTHALSHTSARTFAAAASTYNPRIDVSALTITRTTKPKPKVDRSKLTFGAVTSDHMVSVDWSADAGWATPALAPYQALSVDPAASVFHYGLEAFEGMKAYIDDQGHARLFRPELNMARMDYSLQRLALPPLDKEGALELVKALVRADKDWIPQGNGFSLYLRPTAIATWPYLGVAQAKSMKWFCIACPVGPYYPEGFKPVKLLADSKHVRAWPGGVGNAKVGGNYAPCIKVQVEAAQKGFSQILWLFGGDHEVTEVGTMNFFAFVRSPTGRAELITPPLDGTILPGVTRQSILDLTRQWGEFDVSERKFTMKEFALAVKEKRVLEAFGAGTAAVVSPIKMIHYNGEDLHIPLDPSNPSAGAGPLAQRLWDTLTDIQYGKVPNHPWSVLVD